MDLTPQEIKVLNDLGRETLQTGTWRVPPSAYLEALLAAKQDDKVADALVTKALALRAARRAVAKHDSSAFAEYVLRTEGGGERIRQAPFHDEMHALIRERDRVVIWGSPATGKSLQISVAYALWRLGRDPNLHVAIIQATDDVAKKTIRTVGDYIDNPRSPSYRPLHEVFPHLTRNKAKSAVWNAHAITVERSASARDPSYQCCGLFGNILGARLDVVILDDVLTFNTTRTPEQRRKTIEWILTTVINRLDPENGVLIFMGNAWHPQDAMHVFANGALEELAEELGADGAVKAVKRTWASARYPLRDEYGKTTWPDKWPQETLELRAGGLPPAEAARTFDCLASSDATSRFKRQWFVSSLRPRLAGMMPDGKTVALMRRSRPEDDGRAYYIGVDLAFADIEHRGDRCAIGVIAANLDGSIELVSIRSGRWLIDDLISEIVAANAVWDPRYIFVESNAAQSVVKRMLKGDLAALGLDFPAELKRRIVGFETSVDKHHPKWGIEGIGVEMANMLWRVPCGDHNEVHNEIESWFNDLLHYSPSPKVHTGDRAMAVYMAWDGMRRRLGERALGFVNVVDPGLDLSIPEALAPKPAREGESEDDRKTREAVEKQKHHANLAERLQAAQEASAWAELDTFGW